MTMRMLILLFIASLIVFLTVRMPAGLAVSAAGLTGDNTTIQTRGTVWQGQASIAPGPGSGMAGTMGGTVYFTTRILPLLTLTWSADWRYEGMTVTGDGRLSREIDGALSLKDTRIRLTLDRLQTGLPLTGVVDMAVRHLRLDADGRCVTAEGDARTDALARSFEDIGWRAPVLTGPLDCVDGRPVARLTGRDGMGDISAEWTLPVPAGGGLAGRVDMRVNTDAPTMEFALPRLGFRQSGDGYILRLEQG
ncbi:type II secretion system protein N [Eilatimonas milleporae]|uniref:Type II secretion system protein N n=1 Tax=Eilatimonas milleporae TaxID=911205 RepID=A0A3M0CWP8_9PROT|nr:type II secretion system protein N [Eilatimonas milleporae]RMB11809.1 type II secretion system (T2SS) protein N [Eilatimonas milleporae]